MEKELAEMDAQGVFEWYFIPLDSNLITCKWIFVTKWNANGSLNKYKARLVARGFTQVHGLDYFDTFAPTVCLTAIRAMLAIANSSSMVCHSLHINTAFLHAPLPDNCRCFMHAPPGYVPPANKASNCVRLRKALYGLKQTPCEWNHTLVLFLTEQLGFTQLFSEPSVFFKGAGDDFIAISVHVDDQTIISRFLPPVISLKHALANRFNRRSPV